MKEVMATSVVVLFLLFLFSENVIMLTWIKRVATTSGIKPKSWMEKERQKAFLIFPNHFSLSTF